MESPGFVAVGHVTKDLVAGGGYRLGGAVAYAARTAHSLGLSVAVLTSAPSDLDIRGLLPDVRLHIVPSPVATTFANLYDGERRHQFLHSTATVLKARHLPESWRATGVVLLSPVAGELGADWLGLFPSALVGVAPQGWMREVDSAGRVKAKPWLIADQILSQVDVLVFSEEDVGGSESEVQRYASRARITAVTRGAQGATVFWRGVSREFPAFPARALDPTGAGDVFAAAFLVRLSETGDPYVAAAFANCAAALSVEGHGIDAIPTRTRVEGRLRAVQSAERRQ